MDRSKLLDEVNPEIGLLVREALEAKGDLREYSQNVQQQLRKAENGSIKDYIKESKNIAQLHSEIEGCDHVLETMEKMLLGFQCELGSLSTQIESLQKQSVSMSIQLCNRQAVKGGLSQFVDEMVVPQSLINCILEAPATDPSFVKKLSILAQKVQHISHAKETRAASDVKDVIQKLSVRAISKVRDHLLITIFKFRKPMTNYQILQNGLLKNKFFYEFLVQNDRTVSQEIQEEYKDTMSKVYFSYFKQYSSLLSRKQVSQYVRKENVLAAPEEGYHSRKKAPLFSLGKRLDILNNLEAPALVPHACSNFPLSYEAIFRSLIFAFVDNACREYLFLGEFLILKGKELFHIFHSVMQRSLNHMLNVIEEGTKTSWDAIGLLICAHILLRLHMVTHKRAVPALDDFFHESLNLIWPYLDRSLSSNTYSLTMCKALPSELTPHYITRRYAEFSSAIAAIDAGFPQERVRNSLKWLQEEMDNNLIRMAGAFDDRTKQLCFLINNYDLIVSVHTERGLEPKENDRIRNSLNLRVAEYAEEVLLPHFETLVQFDKEISGFLNREQAYLIPQQEDRAVNVAKMFRSTWKQSLDSVNREVMSSFPSFKTGASVLQQALTLLVQYYHKFQQIAAEHFPDIGLKSAELVDIHQVMVEVKKYKPNF